MLIFAFKINDHRVVSAEAFEDVGKAIHCNDRASTVEFTTNPIPDFERAFQNSAK
jgi:hypothetical protein